MQGSGEESAITGINVTPLVDIILVVLIIFMATAPIIHRRAIKVDVPKAARHDRAATAAMEIVYDAKRVLTLDGKVVTREVLVRLLSRQFEVQPSLHVTLAADKSLPYGEIVRLLDAVRSSGVRKIGLEVVRL